MTKTFPCFLLLVLSLGGCKSKNHSLDDPCSPDAPNPCDQTNRNLCVNEAGQPRCLCNAGFLPRPSGQCEPVDGNNCPEHPGDSAEPDDCLARAQLISTNNGGPKQQSIEPPGDYDYFNFSVTAGN